MSRSGPHPRGRRRRRARAGGCRRVDAPRAAARERDAGTPARTRSRWRLADRGARRIPSAGLATRRGRRPGRRGGARDPRAAGGIARGRCHRRRRRLRDGRRPGGGGRRASTSPSRWSTASRCACPASGRPRRRRPTRGAVGPVDRQGGGGHGEPEHRDARGARGAAGHRPGDRPEDRRGAPGAAVRVARGCRAARRASTADSWRTSRASPPPAERGRRARSRSRRRWSGVAGGILGADLGLRARADRGARRGRVLVGARRLRSGGRGAHRRRARAWRCSAPPRALAAGGDRSVRPSRASGRSPRWSTAPSTTWSGRSPTTRAREPIGCSSCSRDAPGRAGRTCRSPGGSAAGVAAARNRRAQRATGSGSRREVELAEDFDGFAYREYLARQGIGAIARVARGRGGAARRRAGGRHGGTAGSAARRPERPRARAGGGARRRNPARRPQRRSRRRSTTRSPRPD